jgi:flagellar M-ring protein FliF
LVVIGIVVIGFIGFFYFVTTRLTTPSMGLLFAGLDPADSGKIVAKLDAINVPYELKGNGTQILVPNDQVARLRMTVAQEGLPSGGTMGYELFDRSDSLGTSNFVLNIHRLRALEGELARSIGSLSYVRRARVHLVLPQRQLFSRNAPTASASVVLQMQGGRRLVAGEVAGIQQLVAAAVVNLQPSNITIIDGQGTLLARGRAKGGGGLGETVGGNSRREAFEAQMARTIEEILERTVGGGRVRAEVTADMDFDRVSTTTESFDPEGQVVRSTQSVEEVTAAKDSQGTSNAPVSVASTLPSSTPQGNTGAQSSNSNNSNRTEETVNYEISKTTRTHIRESGSVKRISVAVLVDGSYATDADNNRIYKPRTAEEMTELKKLVETAIGFDPKRGDKVEVVNLRFAKGEQVIEEEPRPLFNLGKNDYMRIAELCILAIVSILVILLVIRPLIKRILDALPDAIASSKNLIEESVAAAGSHGGALPPASPDGSARTMALSPANAPGDPAAASIDMDAVEGRVRDSTMKRIGEIVEKHPDEAVNIILNWMYQES